jgi:membrane-anchored protein YejM (alkaline phosphatase superfamily)
MTTHYDVAPTLLDQALGCDAPYTQYTQGINLFDPSPRYPFIIANNFGSVAYLTPGKITALFASGDFSVQDLNGRELLNKKPNLKQFSFVLKKLNYFISNTQTKEDKK